jgi:hypothetical protein
VSDNVVGREDSQRNAGIVYHREPAYVLTGHDAQCGLNIIFGPAGEDFFGGNVSDGQLVTRRNVVAATKCSLVPSGLHSVRLCTIRRAFRNPRWLIMTHTHLEFKPVKS